MRGFTGLLLLVLLFVVLSFRQGIALTSTGSGFRKSATRSFLPRLFSISSSWRFCPAACLLRCCISILRLPPSPLPAFASRAWITLSSFPLLISSTRCFDVCFFRRRSFGPARGAPRRSKLGAFAAFLNATPFNLQDPLFGFDIDFYIFRLPMYSAAYQWLIFALALTLLATAAVYFLYRGIQYGPQGLFLSEKPKPTC